MIYIISTRWVLSWKPSLLHHKGQRKKLTFPSVNFPNNELRGITSGGTRLLNRMMGVHCCVTQHVDTSAARKGVSKSFSGRGTIFFQLFSLTEPERTVRHEWDARLRTGFYCYGGNCAKFFDTKRYFYVSFIDVFRAF